MTSSATLPQDHLIRALILFNGLTVEQVQTLTMSAFDCETGWIRLQNCSVPLVSQTVAALGEFHTGGGWFDPSDVPATLERLEINEAHAHRQLAGALWITAEDTRLISHTAGLTDAPLLPLAYTFPFSVVERMHSDLSTDIAQTSRITLQTAADWLERETSTLAPSVQPRFRAKKILSMLLEGKTVFLLANTGVNGLNLVYNLVMARLLSPAAYSQLALMVTLQLLIGLLPSAWQTTAARFGAGYSARGEVESLYHLKSYGRRRLMLIGCAVMVVSLLASPVFAEIFQLDSAMLLLPLIIMMPLFLSTAADRGVLQGINAFYWLTAAYVGEAIARLGIGILLVLPLVGTAAALNGAVWGVGQSMLITWFIAWIGVRHLRRPSQDRGGKTLNVHPDQAAWMRLTTLTLTALIGQALITNSDFLLVKSLFSPADSGLYAAVSVLGRIAYFGALPLTIIMVPLFARRQALDQPTRPLFFMMLAGGAVLCTGLLSVAALFPLPILTIFYGDAYLTAAPLLPVYTLAASLYVIVNLVITYRVALGKGSETILPMLAGIAQVIGILLFHETLQQVIIVQIVLMSLLLVAVLWRGLRSDA